VSLVGRRATIASDGTSIGVARTWE
jgi:hypothetical protein